MGCEVIKTTVVGCGNTLNTYGQGKKRHQILPQVELGCTWWWGSPELKEQKRERKRQRQTDRFCDRSEHVWVVTPGGRECAYYRGHRKFAVYLAFVNCTLVIVIIINIVLAVTKGYSLNTKPLEEYHGQLSL